MLACGVHWETAWFVDAKKIKKTGKVDRKRSIALPVKEVQKRGPDAPEYLRALGSTGIPGFSMACHACQHFAMFLGAAVEAMEQEGHVSALGNVHTLDMSYCHYLSDVSALGSVYDLCLHQCCNVYNVSDLGGVHTLDLSHCIISPVQEKN